MPSRRKLVDGVPYCSRGHAIEGDNAQRRTDGYLICRYCQRENIKSHAKAQNGLPPETPSVMANYKEPLREVENGYGYMGTIAYNEDKTHTQCHLCGKFYERPNSHIKNEHGMTALEYKDAFSLPATMSLSAPSSRRPAWQRWQNMTEEERQAQIAKMVAGKNAALDAGKGEDWKRKRGKSLFQKNLEGSCPDQLLDKIEVLAKKLDKTPSFRDFKREYGGRFVHAINGTYGSWGEALDILNMVPKGGGYDRIYTPEALIEMLVNFKEENGRDAMTSDFGRGLLPSVTTYRARFGTFLKAKEEAYGGR